MKMYLFLQKRREHVKDLVLNENKISSTLFGFLKTSPLNTE